MHLLRRTASAVLLLPALAWAQGQGSWGSHLVLPFLGLVALGVLLWCGFLYLVVGAMGAKGGTRVLLALLVGLLPLALYVMSLSKDAQKADQAWPVTRRRASRSARRHATTWRRTARRCAR